MLRRDFALGFGSALLFGCSKKRPAERQAQAGPEGQQAASGSGDWQTLSFDPSTDFADGEEALLFTPEGSKTWPTLIALHGRGEAGRGLSAGSHGWRDEYGLDAMYKRICAPPLTMDDVDDMLGEERIAAINASLSSHAYNGISIACPYTPVVADPSPEGASPFARFVVDVLLPRVATASGHPTTRATTGIDGVSMGGRLALLVGLSRPETFASVGAMQPAIRIEEVPLFSSLAKRAIEKAPIALRLLSSDQDPFLEAVHALSAQLNEDAVPHQLQITRGPHDYVWNRGPGACEMLVFHERALRGFPPV